MRARSCQSPAALHLLFCATAAVVVAFTPPAPLLTGTRSAASISANSKFARVPRFHSQSSHKQDVADAAPAPAVQAPSVMWQPQRALDDGVNGVGGANGDQQSIAEAQETAQLYINRCLLLQAKLVELREENQSVRRKVEQLSDELQRRPSPAEEEEVGALRQQCSELKSALSASRAEVEDLSRYNEALRKRYTDQMVRLEANVADLEIELRALEADHARGRRTWAATEQSLKAEREKYRVRSTLLEAEVVKARQQLDDATELNERLTAENRQLRAGIAAAPRPSAPDAAASDAMAAAARAAQRAQADLTAKVAALRQEREGLLGELEGARAGLQRAREDTALEARRRRATRAQWDADVARLEQELDDQQRDHKTQMAEAHRQLRKAQERLRASQQLRTQKPPPPPSLLQQRQQRQGRPQRPQGGAKGVGGGARSSRAVVMRDRAEEERQRVWARALQCMDLWGI
ncbi:hypothetical protein JKP88DRAFT_261310 [Tribonema minus]|uniref:Uncharacterized protein n=1 Tax=Tribonema minus TaxID=303371 RepID=A0A835YWQ2_9STRA|nr:hypothetical protein JKP88DRAFT_261310 [Tribonema minus]